MHLGLRGLPVFFGALALCAQDAGLPQPAGLEASWEIAAVLREVGAHGARLVPVLNKVDAQNWVAKGASDTYLAQLQTSKEQAGALARGAQALASNPERLSAALEVLFRIQGLEQMLTSLSEGMRKYQNPAEAQALTALAAENGANRERLQRYIVNLAAEQEQALKVMDQEAQRCRAALTQTPSRSANRKKK
jgi:hypothetical protein